MELQGERLIPAGPERTWEALNDPAILQDCIPGCETLVLDDDGSFAATMALRLGPVSARMKGRLRLADVQPPRACTLHFDGQGGVAGFGKGSAQVELHPQQAQTRLAWRAHAQVGGKMAQVGSRLVDAAAAKLIERFFDAFEARVHIPGPDGAQVP
ncbi:MAG TPA: carbon monoxide dehydrogenase subunit G [Luteimonas sp.]|nr:carbon monoxide dehydrogenase subunit G [Luteimonas sp.]